jgi:hypothetical protein
MKNFETFKNYYQNKTIEDWGAYMSDDAKKFAKDFKNTLQNELKNFWRTSKLVKFSIGHYEVSGFIHNEEDDVYCYFSYDIPRYERPINFNTYNLMESVLVRTCKNDNDYKGGANQFASIRMFPSLVRRILQITSGN